VVTRAKVCARTSYGQTYANQLIAVIRKISRKIRYDISLLSPNHSKFLGYLKDIALGHGKLYPQLNSLQQYAGMDYKS